MSGPFKVLEISGMSCPGCANKVTAHLKTHNIASEIDFASGQLRVSDRDYRTASSLVQEIGYHVRSKSDHEDDHGHSHSGFNLTIIFCLICTLPLLFGHLIHIPALHSVWIQLALATPVYIIGVFHFGRSALVALRGGIAHMDLLVITGATAAFVYSIIGVFGGFGTDYIFFESAASIITFVMIGGVIEQFAVSKTSAALTSLKSLSPSTVKVVDAEGIVKAIPVADLTMNDSVALSLGDHVPCDGQIVSGIVEVDESPLTGEAIPVTKRLGDPLYAGSLVASGKAVIQPSSIGEETILGKIIDKISSAQFSKPKIQRLGDRVSAVFVPCVLLIGLMTCLINFLLGLPLSVALLRGIAVVVIACPCAMGLATPVAIMVCLGQLAKSGILLKRGDTIEALAAAKVAFFDKTGTLTKGEIQCELVSSAIENEQLSAIVLGLEQHSSHPIARSLVRKYSSGSPIKFESIEETPGVGISGVFMGQRHTISKAGATVGPAFDLALQRENELLATFRLTDSLRPDAKGCIDQLKSQGFEVFLLSGDSTPRCDAVAKSLGIQGFANLSPEKKLEKVKELSAGRIGLFVGDGINDVLGLAGAGIGISFSHASDIAMHTAPVVITRPSLSAIPALTSYSKRVLRTIKQNLFWAFFYNVAAIPIAAIGLLTPTLAAIVMGFSDVVVVGNSLRLRNGTVTGGGEKK